MARRLGEKHALCRRLGEKICSSDKCPAIRRPYPRGSHGPSQAVRKPKLTAYGLQLREKQKAKFIYGLMERQFRSYVDEATSQKGDTATLLMQLLERRLDNAVFRLGIGKTRAQARQTVRHGHVTVNGKKVDIPSYRIKAGEVIALKEKISAPSAGINAPEWLLWDPDARTGRVQTLPSDKDLHAQFDPKLIIEFYSR